MFKYLKDNNIEIKQMKGNKILDKFDKQSFDEFTKAVEAIEDNSKGGDSGSIATSPIPEFDIFENLKLLLEFIVDLFF